MVYWPNNTELPRVHNVKPIEGVPLTLWQLALPDYVYSPTIQGERIIFGLGFRSLVTVDLENRQVMQTYRHDVGIQTGIAVHEGFAYFGDDDKRLIALRLEDQKVAWDLRTKRTLHALPVVAAGVVYVGDRDKNLYALDAKSGKEIWVFHTKGEMRAPVAVSDDGMIYVGCFDKRVYAVYTNMGKPKWHFWTPGSVISSTPALDEQTVYFGSNDFHLYAVDRESAELRWKFKGGTWIRTYPVVHKDKVIYGCYTEDLSDNYLYCLDAATGTVVWRNKMPDISVGPHVVGRSVYVITQDGQLRALDVDPGTELWTKGQENVRVSSVAFADEAIYLAVTDKSSQEVVLEVLGEAG